MDLSGKIDNLPRQPGVYMMKDQTGRVLYVGKALSLRNRVRSYFQPGSQHPPRIKAMVQRVADFDYIVTNSEAEALILECNLIKEYRPRYNVDLKDDKSYPYLKLTNEPYPRLYLTRQVQKDGSRYFGPYTSVGVVRETIRTVKKIFPLRSCRQPLNGQPTGSRPCLNHQIGLCLAPCQGDVSREEYNRLVDEITMFLEGRQVQLYRRLQEAMNQAAGEMNFERAARLRDQLQGIKKVMERQKIVSQEEKDRDVLALAREGSEIVGQLFRIRSGKLVAQQSFPLRNGSDLSDGELMAAFIKSYYVRTPVLPQEILVSEPPEEKEMLEQWLSGLRGRRVTIRHPRRGEKKSLVDMALENARLHAREAKERVEIASARKEREQEALIDLAKIAGLEGPPARIEGYDISHFAGGETVAVMVAFQDGEPDKDHYRRFKIRDVAGIDDYASLQEVIRRRLGNRDLPEPDLMLIDGGKGQLNAVLETLRQQGREDLPALSLAKEYEQVFLPGQKAPLLLPAGDPALQLLQRVRDEAHRFAVTYQRQRRQQASLSSVLDGAPGIGPKRRISLLQAFGSLEKIRAAAAAELAAVADLPVTVAEELYNYLHPLP